jgi:hypothetical protein
MSVPQRRASESCNFRANDGCKSSQTLLETLRRPALTFTRVRASRYQQRPVSTRTFPRLFRPVLSLHVRKLACRHRGIGALRLPARRPRPRRQWQQPIPSATESWKHPFGPTASRRPSDIHPLPLPHQTSNRDSSSALHPWAPLPRLILFSLPRLRLQTTLQRKRKAISTANTSLPRQTPLLRQTPLRTPCAIACKSLWRTSRALRLSNQAESFNAGQSRSPISKPTNGKYRIPKSAWQAMSE